MHQVMYSVCAYIFVFRASYDQERAAVVLLFCSGEIKNYRAVLGYAYQLIAQCTF